MKTRMANIVLSGFVWLKSGLYWVLLPILMFGAVWCSGAFFIAFDAAPAIAVLAVFALWMLILLSVFLRRAILAAALVESAALAAFLCITPQQRFRDTKWQTSWGKTPEVRKLADGRYELENVRDFHYRSEDDYEVDYRSLTVDPEKISSIDAVFSHWDDLEMIAHSMLGLNFSDGTTLVFSLETRLPTGVEQNGICGLYRRYALAMIVGTPEDLYGLRADHRGETLYVYRIAADRKYMRRTVCALLERAAQMQRHPEFYNSLFRNCTTGLLPMLPEADGLKNGDVRLLLNGLAAKMLFERDLLVCREKESFGSLRSRSLVPGICRGKNAPPLRYGGESEARWLHER
jgi:hypothetical protein